MAYEQQFLNTLNREYLEPGNNGLEGFKQWECYMLVKYGKPGVFRY